MFKIKPVQKISLAAMLLILTVVGTRIPALFSIPSFEFVRLSLGPAFIIFSSIVLGPFYGALIGAASDLLGAIVFPQTLGTIGTINPFITLMYGLMGALAWLVFFLIKKIKKTKILTIVLFSVVAAVYLFLLIYLLSNNSITSFGGVVYNFNTAMKIIIIALATILSAGFVISYIYFAKYFESKYKEVNAIIDYRQISFIVFVCELLICLIMGSFVKSFMYGVDFFVIFFIQSIMFFIDIILNSYISCLVLMVFENISKLSRRS